MQNTNYKSITSWKDVCKALGVDLKAKGDLSPVPAFLRPFSIGTIELAMVVKAINGDWEPNYDDNQPKWWGWFDMRVSAQNPTGFRFYASACTRTGAYSGLGSRLCCETQEQFLHIVKHFLPQLRAAYKS